MKVSGTSSTLAGAYLAMLALGGSGFVPLGEPKRYTKPPTVPAVIARRKAQKAGRKAARGRK